MAKLTRPWRMRQLFCSLIMGTLLFLPVAANASPFMDIGYDTSAIGGANADAVFGSSYGVLFTNPAVMSRIEPISGAGFVNYKPQLKIKLSERSKTLDIPTSFYDANLPSGSEWPNDNRPKPTVSLRNSRSDTTISDAQTYLTAGMIQSFGIPGFRFGGATVLPLAYQVNVAAHYFDEREANFTNKLHSVRFGEWSRVVGGLLGVSYAPEFFKYISVGLSLQIGATTTADVADYIPNIDNDSYSLMGTSMRLGLKFRPIVGLQVQMPKPIEWWSLGFTWRNESYMDVSAKAVVDMGNYIKDNVPRIVTQKFRMALDFEPMEITVGTGAKFDHWNIQANYTWSRWSQYLDPYFETPESLAYDSTGKTKAKDFKWKDTHNVSANAAYDYLSSIGVDWVNLKLGFAYKQTPVPAQTGRTNFADSDTFCASLGHRLSFKLPTKKPIPVHFDMGLQFWFMKERKTYKNPDGFYDEFPDTMTAINGMSFASAKGLQTNNPGFPGYKQSGWLLVSSASLNIEF